MGARAAWRRLRGEGQQPEARRRLAAAAAMDGADAARAWAGRDVGACRILGQRWGSAMGGGAGGCRGGGDESGRPTGRQSSRRRLRPHKPSRLSCLRFPPPQGSGGGPSPTHAPRSDGWRVYFRVQCNGRIGGLLQSWMMRESFKSVSACRGRGCSGDRHVAWRGAHAVVYHTWLREGPSERRE